ncbi:MAG: hypothetical protein R3212_09055 [Xanthomonadales bacterium]|nr:hypothetical protein [Xanthomonadales bacterium]
MYYVNLMFLAMAGLIIFMAFVLVSHWMQMRKAGHENTLLERPVPPRKPTVSMPALSEKAAVELNELVANLQGRNGNVNPAPGATAMRMSLRARTRSDKAGEFTPRLH